MTAKLHPASKDLLIIAELVVGVAEARPNGFSNFSPHTSMLRSTRSTGVKNLGSFHSKLHTGNWAVRSIVWSIFHRVGVVSYFIGDNLTELVSHYDIEAARGASAIFFVIALMVFWITPPLSYLIRETHLTSLYKKPTQSKRHWCNAIDTITIILKVDVLYSSVLVMVDASDNICASANINL